MVMQKMDMTVQDAIPDHDCYIFLNKTCDRIAVAVQSPKWASRYCTAPPGLEHFSFPHLKTLYKGKQHCRGRRKEWPKTKKTAKTNSFQFLQCNLLWPLQRTSEEVWPCLCLIFHKSRCGTSQIKSPLSGRWQCPPTHINTYQENKNHWPLVYVVNIFPWLFSKPAPVKKETNKKTICKGKFTSFRLSYVGHYREVFLYSLHCLVIYK